MKELFNKDYVHFLWDNELDGKECFVASEITDLIRAVNNNNPGHKYVVHKSDDSDWPFQAMADVSPSAFAYYDPLYEYKAAWANGKSIEENIHGHRCIHINGVDPEPYWHNLPDTTYTIAPDVLFVHKDKLSGELYYNDCSVADYIYKGTEEECIRFKESYDEHFEEWLKAYSENPEKTTGYKVSLLANEEVQELLKDAYLEGKKNS